MPSGCWVVPGLIDMHVHLREPGYEYKETVLDRHARGGGRRLHRRRLHGQHQSGERQRRGDQVHPSRSAAAADLARVYPIGAVSVGLEGERLAEIGEMREAGIVAVSDDGHPVMDSGLMRRALEYSAMFNLPVIAHEEDRGLAGEGVMHEGPTAFRLGLKGMPAAAEEAMVARDIALLERTGGRLHVAHVSTAGSVDLVRRAKARGLAVTAEVAPHHFTLTDEAVGDYDTNAKMNPPLRDARGRRGGHRGSARRHDRCHRDRSRAAPSRREGRRVRARRQRHRRPGDGAAAGLRLVREHGLSRSTRWSRALSTNPARILGVPRRHACAGGSVADVTVIDPERALAGRARRASIRNRATRRSAAGRCSGAARATIVGGRVVWRADRGAGSRARQSGALGR